MLGAWLGLGGAQRLRPLIQSRVTVVLAMLYLVFAFAVTMTWYFPRYGYLIPKWLADLIYPIDKTNLDILRLVHFFALALLTVYFLPRDWPALKGPWFRPAILCGQHSLEIFCFGVFLAFAGHFIRVEFSGGPPLQILISLAGIGAMIGAAWWLSWYQALEGRGPGARRSPNADFAGGNV